MDAVLPPRSAGASSRTAALALRETSVDEADIDDDIEDADLPMAIETPQAAAPATPDREADPQPSQAAVGQASDAGAMALSLRPADASPDGVSPAGARDVAAPIATPVTPAREVRAGGQPASLEDTVVDMLRPMLRQWLDDNMPRLVAKVLTEENKDLAGRIEQAGRPAENASDGADKKRD